MVNEDLARMFEECRLAGETAKARVKVWEEWAKAEREAQAKGNE